MSAGAAAVLVLVLPLLLAACGTSAGPSQPGGTDPGQTGSGHSGPGSSGVSGRTLVGPTCPVEQTSSPCPPRPIKAVIEARRPRSPEVVGHTASGEQGYFQLSLAPGTYVLTAKTAGPARLPHPKQVTVTVKPDEFAQVTIHLDSGIRGPSTPR